MEFILSVFTTSQWIIVIALLVAVAVFVFKIGNWRGRKQEIESEIKKRINSQRATIKGQVSEQIAPLLPNFPYDISECRFMGKPIDFIVFKGISDNNISEIVFVEVKSGKNKTLNQNEKTLRDAVKNKKVKWVQYNFE
ncbi:MAG: hypothetical protein FWE23_02575 [Chitinivibrionia bacterium]|nr:hypothetical protein [Chitinivibrionia bacterium]